MPVPRGVDAVRVKQCRDCGAVKSVEEFYLNAGSSKGTRGGDGRRSRCIPCYKEFIRQGKDHDRQRVQQREAMRARRAADPELSWRTNLKKYGMTPEDYFEMLRAQGGKCAICGTEECGTGARFSVDHDHSCCEKPKTCGRCNRGLLCRTCNVGIGNLQDSIEILKNAITYLEGALSNT